MTPRWLREAARLAAEHGRTRTANAVERLSAGRERQAWRVTVVGEPGAGKTTLITRLLGREGLPGVEVVEAPWEPGGPPLEAVTDTDGVLLTVPATGVWGAAQARLLEDAVAAHVPSVAVVVTMLDRVGPAERGRVLSHTSARTGRVILLSGPGPAPDDPARTAIRSFVADSAPVPERARLRARRIAAQVADQCTAMATSATETIADARRVHSVQSAEFDPDASANRAWDLLRSQLAARQLGLIGRVGDTLRTARVAALGRLRAERARTLDAKTWWRGELVDLLRAELVAQAERTERLILSGFTSDASWLESEVRRLHPDGEAARPMGALTLRVAASSEDGVLGEVVARGGDAESRLPAVVAGDALDQVVEGCAGVVVRQAWKLLDAAYEPLFADLVDRQRAWAVARENSGEREQRVDWHTLARAATALAGSINAALRSS
ncbi:GTPase domain-containing protein [Actinokineospora auranticolor]|uniref:50S ribosome-binding GTPase n=1 Tax=Actinokineospora auranticolor TaxID=155976 RepID=A0A2S6GJG3_9PSEU|nr:GTPase domain-containing protein [Actinokineospora auranticolor]PPK65372.1 hypothetical protein CLV40_11424 [Actinokineospora auranticolor]